MNAKKQSQRIILRSIQLRERAKTAIDMLPFDATFEVVIREYKRNRSLEANALYWKWLTIIAVDLGSSKDDLHEEYKRKFALPILTRDDADFREMMQAVDEADCGDGTNRLRRQVSRLVSTTHFNTKQMSEYMDEINQHAAGLGICLPHPEDRFYDER